MQQKEAQEKKATGRSELDFWPDVLVLALEKAEGSHAPRNAANPGPTTSKEQGPLSYNNHQALSSTVAGNSKGIPPQGVCKQCSPANTLSLAW